MCVYTLKKTAGNDIESGKSREQWPVEENRAHFDRFTEISNTTATPELANLIDD